MCIWYICNHPLIRVDHTSMRSIPVQKGHYIHLMHHLCMLNRVIWLSAKGKITNEVQRSWVSIWASIIDIPKYTRLYFEITVELKTTFYNRRLKTDKTLFWLLNQKLLRKKKLLKMAKMKISGPIWRNLLKKQHRTRPKLLTCVLHIISLHVTKFHSIPSMSPCWLLLFGFLASWLLALNLI